MSTLSDPLRTQLEKIVRKARIVAEDSAADAIRRMNVAQPDPPASMGVRERALRVRLRAHGRTLGDTMDGKRVQTTVRLQEAAAYEIWHRMLFGRFLVERGLLLHPKLGAPLTLAELSELAPDEGAADGWALAERYATATLPAVFKPDDPVLTLPLDPFHYNQLQTLVKGLDAEVFQASDALGWTYQFWRAAEKERVDAAGTKIGVAELPAVTQLFTEPYMVRFLLHNTLGAWWAGKVLSANPDLARESTDERELRAACALPEIEWEYLRFVRDPADGGSWRPAAGTYPGWPDKAAEITLLDPCCGSGHFLVEALPILAALRVTEEGMTATESARAVLRDNLHGLEIDGRCVQIAAFAVALAAWQISGAPAALPNPHLAWVGAPPPLPRREMAALANGDSTLQRGFEALYDQFLHAPLLGSLMDVSQGDLLDHSWRVQQGEALAKLAVRVGSDEPERAEGAVAARGLLDALGLLSRRYTLQTTNVPFLGASKMVTELKEYLAKNIVEGKGQLATAFLLAMLNKAADGGAIAIVSPQNWYQLGSYRETREALLDRHSIRITCDLGPAAFHNMNWWAARTALTVVSAGTQAGSTRVCMFDAGEGREPEAKPADVKKATPALLPQSVLRRNPDARIIIREATNDPLLATLAGSFVGFQNGDRPRWVQLFWEQESTNQRWFRLQMPVNETVHYGGRDSIILWESAKNAESARVQGREAWGKRGVLVRQMGHLPVALYDGDFYDQAGSVIVPKDNALLDALWAFCSSGDFNKAVRKIDRKSAVTNATMVKVPFNFEQWQKVAAEKYPKGLPSPYSDDPTQWLFHGHPAFATGGTELHVALARLAGFRWPAEVDAAMQLAPEARKLIAMSAALPPTDADGLLPLHARGSYPSLADRLRTFLASAFGLRWSNSLEVDLVREADAMLDEKLARDVSLDTWLRERAFRQHCKLFHDRPFLWQVTDGLREGCSAFLHYHRLDYAKLKKFTYEMLGDWLARARDEGQTARAERARALQQKLEVILEGREPYDIFVRWKPLEAQPMGWEPDLDDGVRQNIRPFITADVLTHDLTKILKDKDRGNDAASAPWYAVFDGERRNDHHTSLAEKQAAREQR